MKRTHLLVAALSALVLQAGCAGSDSSQAPFSLYGGQFANGTMTRTVGAVTAETVTISGTIDGNGSLSGNATSSVRGASPMTGTVGPDGTIVMNFTWGAVNYRGNGQVIRDSVDRTHVSGSATVGEVGAANPPQYAIDWTYSP